MEKDKLLLNTINALKGVDINKVESISVNQYRNEDNTTSFVLELNFYQNENLK